MKNICIVTGTRAEYGLLYSPSPNTSQLAARMKARRTLRSLGEGGWKGFGEFRKDTSELCSEELHLADEGSDADPDLQLQIIATGMHLSPEFGPTYHQIEADGFTIDAKVETLPSPYEFPESDKVIHVLACAPLGFLMVYASSRPTSSANLIFVGAFLAFLYGVADEIHQAFVPGRDASALDAMADGTGAMIGSSVFVWTRRNGSKGVPTP